MLEEALPNADKTQGGLRQEKSGGYGTIHPEKWVRDADAADKAFKTPSPEVSSVVRSAPSRVLVFKLIHLCFELYMIDQGHPKFYSLLH